MIRTRLSLAAFALALACAHAPASRVLDASGPVPEVGGTAPAPGQRQRLYVTGSRLPQYTDPHTGRLITTSPVEIYTRGDLLRSGVSADMAAALYRLDPSFR